MAALSENSTVLVREAMVAAKRYGAMVSFDCNYRPSLWKSRGGRQGSVDVNRSLMPMVDVSFGHEGDVSATLGESSHGPVWHKRCEAGMLIKLFDRLHLLVFGG